MSIQFSAKALTPPIGKMLRIFPAGAPLPEGEGLHSA